MNKIVPLPVPPRVPAVEPELLASALFLFGEYLDKIAAEAALQEGGGEDEDGKEARPPAPEVNTRAALDLFASELGTGVAETLALYLRVTAFHRLLARSPALANHALDAETGAPSETALLAASRLDLAVKREGAEGAADFDPKAFRAALNPNEGVHA